MYVDSSVLVKLFVREPDSDYWGRLLDRKAISSSMLAYTEVWSALTAKARSHSISRRIKDEAWRRFDLHCLDDTLELTSISDAILRRANWIIERVHSQVPLRSLDAIHLATADQLQDWPLVTDDLGMRAAAAAMGYPLCAVPPE